MKHVGCSPRRCERCRRLRELHGRWELETTSQPRAITNRDCRLETLVDVLMAWQDAKTNTHFTEWLGRQIGAIEDD